MRLRVSRDEALKAGWEQDPGDSGEESPAIDVSAP